MPTDCPHLILVTGITASGKSSVAQRLAERFPRAYDDIGLVDHYDRVVREGTPRIGHWLDTSHLEVEDTVLEILADLECSRVRVADAS